MTPHDNPRKAIMFVLTTPWSDVEYEIGGSVGLWLKALVCNSSDVHCNFVKGDVKDVPRLIRFLENVQSRVVNDAT